MESLLVIGLIVAVGVALLQALITPPQQEKVVYLVQAPQAPQQAQGGSGVGCLLMLLVGVLAVLALFPGV